MSVVQKNVLVSVEEYLEAEQHAQIKHEYVHGRVYAMVGASRRHNKLTLALASALRSHLRDTGCEVLASGVKVRIGDVFYYPDVQVTCSTTDTDPYFSTEPVLIIEVLSPSTEAADRLDKRLSYQSLANLAEYVLVSQERPQGQVYRRAGATWDLETYGEDDTVRLVSVDFSMPVTEIYRDVTR
jgi:Uma2 family endonuclease